MNRRLLTAIIGLVICAAVAFGVFGVTKAIQSRNTGADPNAVTDPVNAGDNTDLNGSGTNTGSGTNSGSNSGNTAGSGANSGSGTSSGDTSGNGAQSGDNSGNGTNAGDSNGNGSGNDAQTGGNSGNGENGSGNGSSGDSNGTSGEGGASSGAKPTDKISAYLVMGIDRHGEAGDVEAYVGGGQSDVMNLVVFNDTAKTYAMIQIDRDTMVTLDRLDIYGKPYATVDGQICLAYGLGTGTEKSAENAVCAVKRLLGEIPVDGYAAMTFEGLPALNDTLGGIKVKIEDDFSAYDKTLVMGETVELTGEHALNYVHGRMSVGDGLNVSRMRRQRTYLAAFKSRLFEEMKVRSGIINDLYNAAKPYMVTNMSASLISRLAIKTTQYADLGTFIPQGEFGTMTGMNGKSYRAFYADEDALRELVRTLFGNVSF